MVARGGVGPLAQSLIKGQWSREERTLVVALGRSGAARPATAEFVTYTYSQSGIIVRAGEVVEW